MPVRAWVAGRPGGTRSPWVHPTESNPTVRYSYPICSTYLEDETSVGAVLGRRRGGFAQLRAGSSVSNGRCKRFEISGSGLMAQRVAENRGALVRG